MVFYGIESYSNRVYGACRIHLPLYGKNRPVRIEVDCSEAAGLDMLSDGDPLPTTLIRSDGNRYTHAADCTPAATNVLRLELRTRTGLPWTLLKLSAT